MAGNLLKYLPKPTSFSIPTGNANKASASSFSGPIVSIIPKEARRMKKSGAGAFDAQEPTSPKVSCMGQVTHMKSKSDDKKKSKSTKKKPPTGICQSFNGREEGKMRKKPSAIQRMFRRKVMPGRAAAEEVEVEEVAVGPAMGRMRKYASRREALGDFDWRTVVAAEEEEEVVVSHSGPILLGGGMVAREVEKRKEVNLWKRRTMAAPEPLQVN